MKLLGIKKSPKEETIKMASDLHRTATTTYLCCVPTLEESAGAGRVGLASEIYNLFIFLQGNCEYKKSLYIYLIKYFNHVKS